MSSIDQGGANQRDDDMIICRASRRHSASTKHALTVNSQRGAHGPHGTG
jgi:hypothetical protein